MEHPEMGRRLPDFSSLLSQGRDLYRHPAGDEDDEDRAAGNNANCQSILEMEMFSDLIKVRLNRRVPHVIFCVRCILLCQLPIVASCLARQLAARVCLSQLAAVTWPGCPTTAPRTLTTKAPLVYMQLASIIGCVKPPFPDIRNQLFDSSSSYHRITPQYSRYSCSRLLNMRRNTPQSGERPLSRQATAGTAASRLRASTSSLPRAPQSTRVSSAM